MIWTIIFSVLMGINGQPWMLNMEEAVVKAKASEKNILLYFSGSDWCRPCIQFKSEVLENEEFLQFAQSEFVMVLADFPKRKKNRLSPEQTAHNEALAEQYNLDGYFPLLVILDADKNVLSRMGYEPIGVEAYIQRLREF